VRQLGVVASGVVLLLTSAVLTACDGSADSEKPAPSPEVVAQGELVVCTELPYAPFVDETDDGEPTGFEIELLERMAAGLDLDLAVRTTPYAALDDGRALRNDRCDVAAGALVVTDDRREQMAFVEPHYDVRLTLLVPTASDVGGLADLSGRRLAVQEDTTAESYARQHAPADAVIELMAGDQYMFDALRQGRVDGVLQELPVNLVHTASARFTTVETHPTGEQYGFAVRNDAPGLRRALDRQLQQLRQDGTYDALYAEYFTTG
jgi:polar amino acid transport system substrate-binding protein